MQDVLSTIVVGAICVAVSYAVAYCFPSKAMLDAEAVERELSPLNEIRENEPLKKGIGASVVGHATAEFQAARDSVSAGTPSGGHLRPSTKARAMHRMIRTTPAYALALFFGLSFTPSVRAQAADFTAGSRVEGRIGSNWDQCTVIGPRRPTGGYMLRCDSHPDQETVFAASDVRAMQGVDRGPVRKPVVAPRGSMTAPAVSASSRAFMAIPPRVGVYGCMDQDAHETPGLQFGLLDGSTYSTFDGGRGRYAYSGQSGVLTFTSGPMAGLRRMRETERTFRILDEHGRMTAFACPWTPKSPRKLHW